MSILILKVRSLLKINLFKSIKILLLLAANLKLKQVKKNI